MYGTGAGVAPTDLRTRPHHLHEFIRNDLLLVRRTARYSRHRRSGHALDCAIFAMAGRVGPEQSVAWKCFRCTGISWMLCGWSFSPSFTFWAVEGKNGNIATAEQWVKALRRLARSRCQRRQHGLSCWPSVLHLLFAGLLTNVSVSMLGAVLALAGCIGWFREVFPHEHEEVVPVLPEDISVTTERRVVERLPLAPEQVRAWLPVETYPVSAGVKGGLAGGVAMAVLACAYGLLKAGSIWYPINLLAAVVYAESQARPRTVEFLSRGHLSHCRYPASSPAPHSWDCSTAPCFRCSRAIRSSWGA